MTRRSNGWWYRLAHLVAVVVGAVMAPTYPDIAAALLGSALILFSVAVVLDR